MEVLSLIKNSIQSSHRGNRPVEIPISQIRTNPNQPRKDFNPDSLNELAASIRRYGVIQPITVKQGRFQKYELIAGERRLRAAKLAGMSYISAIVIEATPLESASIALVENLQRENLNFLDEAEAYNTLIKDFALTQTQLAERLGKSQASIANKIRILKLSPSIKKTIREKQLTERHARALLRLNKEGLQLRALRIICEDGLNVKQTDELITKLMESPVIKKEPQKEEVVEKKDFKDYLPQKEKPKKAPKARLRALTDVRLFSNTIKQAVEMMNRAGIDAKSEKIDNGNYIEFTVTIPKTEYQDLNDM